jgi:hypothetical protein
VCDSILSYKEEQMTYVPPRPPAESEEIVANGSSINATLAPKFAAKREALTPPLPPPMVMSSKSKSSLREGEPLSRSAVGVDALGDEKRRPVLRNGEETGEEKRSRRGEERGAEERK